MSALPGRYMQSWPMVSDLRQRARRRLPHVAWEYLDQGTSDEGALSRNVRRMSEVVLVPKFMKGVLTPDLKTTLFGQQYNAPFGMAPVGLTGLMWPEVELSLARAAARNRIPYCLSTVATQTPETIGPLAGDMGWFQLYPPRDPAVRRDLLRRAHAAGFRTLVVTADVPTGSRRERSVRAGMTMPPRITPRFVYEALLHPTWTYNTLRAGLPRLRTVETYADSTDMAAVMTFIRQHIGGTLSWDYLKALRDEWRGPIVLKGIVHPEDALQAVAVGVEGIQVSNHGARQFDAVPAAIDSLAVIAPLVKGKTAVLFDSGVRSGLDILRALALGADFVFLGRAFIYGVAALGEPGAQHTVDILLTEMVTEMHQLGIEHLSQLEPPDPRHYVAATPFVAT